MLHYIKGMESNTTTETNNTEKGKTMMTMTITVPTNAGELAYFSIKFNKANLDEVVEMVGLLEKPSDVILAAEMGEWEIA